MLQLTPRLDGLEHFRNEFENLRKLRHQNIVRLLGYCYEIKHEHIELGDGKSVFAQNIYKALCFEYLQNGSLQKHLDDEYHGLEWQTRYKIIKGTCEGLKYLHEGLESPIYHLDLKPDNILLDTNMVPKLADFGLSKLVGNEQTQAIGTSVGTIGYLPPEFIAKNLVSKKLDIFSLGVVIMKIMTGEKGHQKFAEMSSQEFIDLVHENWKNRLQAKPGYVSLEAECHQVKRCIEIALDCVRADRKKRPPIGVIIDELNETENAMEKMVMAVPHGHRNVPHMDDQDCQEAEKYNKLLSAAVTSKDTTNQISPGPIETELLSIYPLELRFPFEPNKQIRCTLNLTNKTDHYVLFIIRPNNPDRYGTDGLVTCVWPHFTHAVSVVMKGQQQRSSNVDELQAIMINTRFLELSTLHNNHDKLFQNIREMGGNKVSLMAVICDPDPASEAISHRGSLRFDKNSFVGELTCIDTHPTEPWISTGHDKGYVCIFKGKPQASRLTFEITDYKRQGHFCHCVSVRFIARKQWLVSGDSKGIIHVYTYVDGFEEIKKVKAHRSHVRSVAVHPTRPFLLSSSDDHRIKLWDWDKGWVCTQEFQGHWTTVRQVTFDPRHNDKFASVSGKYNSFWTGSIKIWSIGSSRPVAEWNLEGSSAACYITVTGRDRQYMAIGKAGEHTKIWDVESKSCVHGLEEQCSNKADVVAVACHPTLPILVSGTNCGHVSLWNPTSYRLEKVFQFAEYAVKGFGFMDVEGFKRLVIGYSDKIELVEINWPTGQQ